MAKPRPISHKAASFSSSQALTQNEDSVREITTLLNSHNWQALMESSDIPKKLNTDVIRSVILQNQVGDPKRLLNFFYWSQHKMGTSNAQQDLDVLSALAVNLCNSNWYGPASDLIKCIIRNSDSPLAVLGSIVKCYRSCNGSPNSVIFDMLMDSYRKMGFLVEAVNVFLGPKNFEFRPSLLSCNSLLGDLLKGNKVELFWKVFDGMCVHKVLPDVYTYTNMISAHCKVGNVKDAKRVLLEMGVVGWFLFAEAPTTTTQPLLPCQTNPVL